MSKRGVHDALFPARLFLQESKPDEESVSSATKRAEIIYRLGPHTAVMVARLAIPDELIQATDGESPRGGPVPPSCPGGKRSKRRKRRQRGKAR